VLSSLRIKIKEKYPEYLKYIQIQLKYEVKMIQKNMVDKEFTDINMQSLIQPAEAFCLDVGNRWKEEVMSYVIN
jgi:hypothetical protein